jgi:uncharacterized protein (DUF433 family)
MDVVASNRRFARPDAAVRSVILKLSTHIAITRVLEHLFQVKLLERITVEPGKCGGQPCIRGKRMRVTDILELLSHGANHEEILADYSFLERDDILAAIAYALRLTDHVVLSGA